MTREKQGRQTEREVERERGEKELLMRHLDLATQSCKKWFCNKVAVIAEHLTRLS